VLSEVSQNLAEDEELHGALVSAGAFRSDGFVSSDSKKKIINTVSLFVL